MLGRGMSLRLALVAAASLLALVGCGRDAATPQADERPGSREAASQTASIVEAQPSAARNTQTTPTATQEYAQWLKDVYEKAKESGEQIPTNILDWAKSDMKKIGTFDYKIVTFKSEPEEKIVAELQRLGSERWECFWVEQTPDGKKFYMKKAVRSYLHLAGRALSVVPVPGASEK